VCTADLGSAAELAERRGTSAAVTRSRERRCLAYLWQSELILAPVDDGRRRIDDRWLCHDDGRSWKPDTHTGTGVGRERHD